MTDLVFLENNTVGINIKDLLGRINFFRKKKQRDYYRDWISEQGKCYRLGVYERQKQNGTKPLASNPTIEEIKEELFKYNPKTILEVGCGWGRLMEPLSLSFDIEGCDVSMDLIKQANPALRIFYWDVVKDRNPFPDKKWDIVFTRGVILYFMEDEKEMKAAMNNLIGAANKAVILWEWPEVIKKVNKICPSNMIVGKIVKHLEE